MSATLPSPGKWKFHVIAYASYSGNCGDGSDSGSTDIIITVGASPKHWKPAADNSPSNIGQYAHVDENGNTVEDEDGRMVQPVDQTVSGSPATMTVGAGEPLECEVESVTDQDQWSMVMADGSTKTGWEEDETQCRWSAEGGVTPGSNGSFNDDTSLYTTWTAPLAPGTYTIKCTINDRWGNGEGSGDPTGAMPPETGIRNDTPIVRSVQVIVLPPVKRWSAVPEITGTITTLTGDTQVAPGGGLTLSVGDVVDIDSWTLGGQSGQENDSVTAYHWNGPGTFGSPSSASTTWTAPSDAGSKTYTLTCTLDDAPAAVPTDENSIRDDPPTTKTINITVPAACQITLSSNELKWNSVLMNWTQCQDDDFQSYKLYRSTDSASFTPSQSTYISRGGDETIQSKTGYRDSGLSPQTTYYYALVTAHGGTTTISRKSITTPEKPPFEVKFENQLARACAGGIGVDGVHDFTITGEAKNEDGTLVTDTALEFSFENNKGHTYSDGREQKKAKFAIPKTGGGYDFVETVTATTNEYGKVDVYVLSSDIISKDIEIKVKWKNAQNQLKEVGNKSCDFGEAVSLRRFPDLTGNDSGDSGWIFDYPNLSGQGDTTPAKLNLKFMKNPELGNVNGNWAFVNGHNVLIAIDNIQTRVDSVDAPGDTNDYATIQDTSTPEAIEKLEVTSIDGAAQVTIKAGTMIGDAETVWVAAYDQSQWTE